ncbi:thyrotropin-releasing hormone receptor [Elysia marginata]|uniref:Thyrotropin-releasing hormone receptor n=1 Tax=Elysia marginata TaxID=1093978 RepID=A0AAV4GIR0_9GAST|nr:thyrotropin-releasing hormone receptor [Elysia marginata]
MNKLSPANLFVVLLGIFDACALSVKLSGQLMKQHGVHGHAWCCKFLDPLSISFSTTANWFLVLICLERFISVCYPLKKRYLFTKKRSFIIAAVLIGLMFTLIMTSLGVTRTFNKKKCFTNASFRWYFENVWLYLNVALHFFLPFILIIFLTSFIIHGLRKSREHRMSLVRKSNGSISRAKVLQDGGGAGKKSRSLSTPITPVTPTALHNQRMLDDTARLERTITLMLIAASIFFLVSALPMSLYYLLRGFRDNQEVTIETARWVLYQQIAYVCVDSSHAINFFLYFFTAKRFRVQLIRTVTGRARCCERRISPRRRSGNSSNIDQAYSGPDSKMATFNLTSSSQSNPSSRKISTTCLPQVSR